MTTATKWRYFFKEYPDGRVELLPTLPAGVVMPGPIKYLDVEAPGIVTPPKGPMTPQEFNDFMNNMPVGAKVNIGMVR